MEDARVRPYALTASHGWIYNYGIDFAVKAGELGNGRQLAFVIRSDGDVRLLAVTSPAHEEALGGWGGFVADVEEHGELRRSPGGQA
jgi:hypothetical protein